jgi:hypothetical protein
MVAVSAGPGCRTVVAHISGRSGPYVEFMTSEFDVTTNPAPASAPEAVLEDIMATVGVDGLVAAMGRPGDDRLVQGHLVPAPAAGGVRAGDQRRGALGGAGAPGDPDWLALP